MERIKRPERIEKMERGLFIILLKHEIPTYSSRANVKLMQYQNEVIKLLKMNYLILQRHL